VKTAAKAPVQADAVLVSALRDFRLDPHQSYTQ
jgi:hypothetical protein